MRGKKNNNPFLFKQFEVQHHLCAHKVGFDGVVLGAWANFNDAKSILDIGTGSGLIALIAAQKNIDAKITGIEIDTQSSTQAKENFINSLWKNRLELIEDNFLEHEFNLDFDHIVSNPPYFINSLDAPLIRRTNARHNSIDNFTQLIQKIKKILSESGLFSLIIPTAAKDQLLSIINHCDFHLSRICNVFTKSREISERILLECTLNKCDVEEKDLFVYDSNGNYSAEYIKLTNQFYLNF